MIRFSDDEVLDMILKLLIITTIAASFVQITVMT